jgi:hypothetical protein
MILTVGAVSFGAMSSIGNGPNFMVKAMTECSNVGAPSFLDCIVRFALPVLLPFLALIGILFFSPWHIPGSIAPCSPDWSSKQAP